MENLRISETVRLKLLNKHGGLTRTDVEQCFANREGKFLVDNREEHKTDPQTLWFVAENYYGRLIKIVFIPMPDGQLILKSAYTANATEIAIYQQLAL
jgi:uncharacterized DUF497 family protein